MAWAYLFLLASGMEPMGTGGAARTVGGAVLEPALRTWTATEFAAMFVMWAIMMVAMMVPSAAPMILLHARVQRQADVDWPGWSTWAFTGGYLTAWTGFSLVATLLQFLLERAALLSPMMVATSRWFGAGVLLAAGLYQLTPLKQACLQHCRSPLAFVTAHWRPGVRGAFAMGLHHGSYCVGCCWFLMALLFVGGIMNLLWIAFIAGFVLLEKLAPAARLVVRTSGVLLIGAAVVTLLV